ncbi:sensor histidine kinase [Stenotrophomonas maltophilia]|jgi:two-component system capsular synthesis sensor histidine kinase RcsC|uniref:sensor histidine kinase n=1 Tax=Stenotrophomonas maltophilia TaxID=40324 RepID=UPI0016600ACB|nr:ATP-binding protein [Stenotrophomonas maltophilia]
MPSSRPAIAASLYRLHARAGAGPADGGELLALRRYPRRLMLACGAVLSLLSISVLITLIVVQVNAYEARRIADFRRAHNALQIQLARQDASYARLANMAEYAWGHDARLGQASSDAMYQAYLQGGQRLLVVADDSSRPQMALGLQTLQWQPRELKRYLQLSAAVSLIQRLTRTSDEGEPVGASYFFDPSGQYLSLDNGLTERNLADALGMRSREELFAHLRAPAQLLAPASLHDQVPLLESLARSDAPQRTFGRHPISGEPSLVSVFQASAGDAPIATFVAYEPLGRLRDLLRRNSQGHLMLLDRDGLRVLSSREDAHDVASADVDWVLLGNATRARFHNGRFTLALAVNGTPWTLVETYRWRDILRGIAPMLLSGVASLIAALAVLWVFLLWLHKRMYMPALRQVKAIYARDQRLRLLLEYVPVGVALLDARSGEVQDLNSPLQRMDRACGGRLIPELRAAAVQADLAEGPLTLSGELPLVTDPQRRLFHRTQVHCGGHAWPGGVLLMVEDISEDMRALQAEQEQTIAAESCSRAKSHFVAAMSHEIRTPLHGIIGHLELLGRAPLPSESMERVLRLRQSADSLMDIITDVLDLSRIESGQWTLTPERFSPAAMLERVALLYAPMANTKGLQLDCVVGTDVPESAVAPMAAIERVLRNLASNALKFTASGRVQLGVSCRREDAQAWLRFEATDSGIGLSQAECERLFQPFVQADTTILSRFGGSGLGLALCQQLCERMGGRIWVESTPGVGSRFVFEAPLATSVTQAAAVPLAGQVVGLLAAAGPWRAELERRIRGWGAQVVTPQLLAEAPWLDLAEEAAVVMFEPSPGEWDGVQRSGRAWVRVCREGPLRPQWQGGGQVVSCYASESLYQALIQIVSDPPVNVAIG